MNHQTSKLSMIPLAARVCLALCVASWVHGASSAAAAPGSVNENWLAVVQQQIADEEYFVTWQERTLLDDIEAAWHAPNRAHDFRSYFTERGIRVVPRTETENPWEWGLALVSYGRGERDMALESAAPAPARNRIEYNRSSLDEWFVNSSKGIKHGFTLYGPPQPSQDDPVHLTLVLGGNLTPIFSTDRQAIDFRSPEGICVMRYAGLTVNDATGRLLPAWMAGNEERGLRTLRIYLDDREAVYPVTVDPIATSAAWTVNGGQVDAEFG